MTDTEWEREGARALGVFLNGDELEREPDGSAGGGDSFLVLFNAHHEGVEFIGSAANRAATRARRPRRPR